MQSPEVVSILFRDKVYRADINESRERRDYSKDIEQLNGLTPIWCYVPNGTGMCFETMRDSSQLFDCHCEMSQVEQEGCWDNYFMIEFEIDDGLLKEGKSHNGNSKCRVFGELTLDMVKAVYKVTDCGDEDNAWYYKDITPIRILSDDCTFRDTFYGYEERKKIIQENKNKSALNKLCGK